MASEVLGTEIPAGPPDRGSDELEELLTVEEVAALLKVSKSWVYEHSRSRAVPRAERLPYVKVGKYVRFDARLVHAFLVKRTRLG